MLTYYLVGFLLGAGSSVIPGPCGLAVLDAAMRLGRPRAIATAIGAGLGDLAYGALGVLGVGHVVANNDELVEALLVASGVILIVYGLVACLHRPTVRRVSSGRRLGGVAIGFVTLVCNPGALVMWSAVGIHLADASSAASLCTVFGIGSGSVAWFVGMACVSARGSELLGARMHRVVDVVGCSIVVYGTLTLARALL